MTDSMITAKFNQLPSITELLSIEPFRSIAVESGHETSLRIARRSLEEIRRRLSTGEATGEREGLKTLASRTAEGFYRSEKSARTTRVINATGVIVHTNLGRSALSDDAIEALKIASGYCNLEYDLIEGTRGKRGAGAEALLCSLTRAEAAVMVNNCAAAAFLVLRVFAQGKDVIISRGELVEIGGDFRVPDVLAESGAKLKEVGTTNRTKIADYEAAISDTTGLLMRVHPSNYRVIGFTESPTNAELATLAKENNLLFFEDAGSGAIVDLSDFGLDEPAIASSIADGVDIVAFSGDKLLGGIQAGLIVGRRDLIEAVRRHPLYRALRVDKLSYAAIEATLMSYAKGRHLEEIPTLKMLAYDAEAIRVRAEELSGKFSKDVSEGIRIEIVEGESVIGGGAGPDVKPKTWLFAVFVSGRSAEEIDAFFRSRATPVIGRISADRYLLDLRTVPENNEAELLSAIESLAVHEF